MSEEEQKVVSDAATEIMNEQFTAARERDQFYIKKAQEAGMKYFEPSDEQIREFAKAAREKVWPQMDEEVGSDIMNTIRENATKL